MSELKPTAEDFGKMQDYTDWSLLKDHEKRELAFTKGFNLGVRRAQLAGINNQNVTHSLSEDTKKLITDLAVHLAKSYNNIAIEIHKSVMKKCVHCDGLVHPANTECPNCKALQ